MLCRAAGQPLQALFRERHAFEPGQRPRLRAETARTHLFDAASGARL